MRAWDDFLWLFGHMVCDWLFSAFTENGGHRQLTTIHCALLFANDVISTVTKHPEKENPVENESFRIDFTVETLKILSRSERFNAEDLNKMLIIEQIIISNQAQTLPLTRLCLVRVCRLLKNSLYHFLCFCQPVFFSVPDFYLKILIYFNYV